MFKPKREHIDPIVYFIKWFQKSQKTLFVLPDLINFIGYRTIKISCESTLFKPSGKMEWNNVNPILCSVSYLPFLLRHNITQS